MKITLELEVEADATISPGCKAWLTPGGAWNPPDPPTVDDLTVTFGGIDITDKLDNYDLEQIEQQLLERKDQIWP
jgi:hypothetical protein